MFNSIYAPSSGGGASESRVRQIIEESTAEGYRGWVYSDFATIESGDEIIDLFNAGPDVNEVRVGISEMAVTDSADIHLQIIDQDGQVVIGGYDGYLSILGVNSESYGGAPADAALIAMGLAAGDTARGEIRISRGVTAWIIHVGLFSGNGGHVSAIYETAQRSDCTGIRLLVQGTTFSGGFVNLVWRK